MGLSQEVVAHRRFHLSANCDLGAGRAVQRPGEDVSLGEHILHPRGGAFPESLFQVAELGDGGGSVTGSVQPDVCEAQQGQQNQGQ